ncbi:MAG: hypothetical protein IKV20_00690 [Clostridia bacterium]|nr:hypothetical protein [Clostridia bacterium]
MNARRISVDFSKKCGKLKPYHAVSQGARTCGVTLSHDATREFCEIGIPLVRLNDVEYPYGSNQFVDIHCIFPDFSKDPEDPESYNFAPTDAYVRAIRETGADVIFRLGESTDPFPKKLYAKAPADYEKWACVCEHIVMHYNEGFADGYKMNLKQFEIFGGADDPRVFEGKPEEFFELYRVVANRLKERFPRIKVGGYGSGGFYSFNRLNATEEQKTFVPYLRAFLRYISAPDTKAPLDFLTWYCYPTTPEELALHARYARSTLEECGHKRAKSYLVGYNTHAYLVEDITDKPSYAAELASDIISLTRCDVDLAVLADAPSSLSYGRTFLTGGAAENCPVYHTLLMYGELYKLGYSAETVGDSRSEIYTLAATSGERHALMIVTRQYSGNLEVKLSGTSATSCRIRRIASRDGTHAVSSVGATLPVGDNTVAFRADKDAIYFLSFDE